MSDVGTFLRMQEKGNTLEVARLARAFAQPEDNSCLSLNSILFRSGDSDPGGRILQEKARHLELLEHAPEQQRAVLLYNLGCFALYNDDILAAKLRFGEAARLRPNHYPSLHNLALTHEMMADFEDAREELGRTLNVNSDGVLTRINLAAIRLVEGEVEEGLGILRELAAADPENMGVTLYLCRGLLENSGQEGAREVSDLLDARPGWEQYPELKECRAYACYLEGGWNEAEALFQELLEADSENAFARMGLIKVFAAEAQYKELLKQLERFRELHPSQSVDHVIDKIRGN